MQYTWLGGIAIFRKPPPTAVAVQRFRPHLNPTRSGVRVRVSRRLPPGRRAAAAASGRRGWTTGSDHLQSFRVHTGPGGQHGQGPWRRRPAIVPAGRAALSPGRGAGKMEPRAAGAAARGDNAPPPAANLKEQERRGRVQTALRLPPPRPPSQRLLPEGGGRTATARKSENRPEGA